MLCDRMLLGLGQWLRIAGYDTVWAEGDQADREVVAWAVREDRILLTCDQEILEHRAAQGRVYILPSNDVEEGVAWVKKFLGVDWMCAPLSRCLRCNEVLLVGGEAEMGRLPEGLRGHVVEVMRCPGCDRIFWEGTHAEAMLKRLKGWA